MPASQAGRRGFDPRPPLHPFKNSQKPVSPCAPFVLRLHHVQAFLQLVDRRQPAFDRRLRVDILADIETVAELVGDQFAVHAQPLHERRMGPAHHEKIHPAQPDLCQLRMHRTTPAIVSGQRSHPLRRKDPGIVADGDGHHAPPLNLHQQTLGQGSLAKRIVGLWSVEPAAMNSLANVRVCRGQTPPSQREDFAGTHPGEDGKLRYQPLPVNLERQNIVVPH